MGDDSSVPGASEEVILHHGAEHIRLSPGCKGAPSGESLCDCGTSLAIVCLGCGRPVFVAVVPGTMCEHARGLIAS